MPGFNAHSDHASNSTTEQDTDCLNAQRSADNMLFVMVGMVLVWAAWLIVSLIELA
jgi:hypothetical protein